MSLSIALKTANSGLLAAQSGLRTVSDNIANVNTPGYVRKTLDQSQLSVNGMGMGVRIDGEKGAVELFLGVERRIDPDPLVFGTATWFTAGFRLLSQ